jgi:hypothetical protein
MAQVGRGAGFGVLLCGSSLFVLWAIAWPSVVWGRVGSVALPDGHSSSRDWTHVAVVVLVELIVTAFAVRTMVTARRLGTGRRLGLVGFGCVVLAAAAAVVILRPYGSYWRTSNPGCTPDGPCGSPSAVPTWCPNVFHAVPADREGTPARFGVAGSKACRGPGYVREGAAVVDGVDLLGGVGMIAVGVRRDRRPEKLVVQRLGS